MKNAPARRDLIRVAVFAVLLYIKCRLFYPPLHLGGFEAAFSLATTGILMAVWAAASLFPGKCARMTANVLYFFISALLSVDAVYQAYTSKLPSATQLAMAWQIGGVSDSVMGLLKPRHIALIIDLPLWFLSWADRDLIRKGFEHSFLQKPAARVRAFLDKPLGRPWAVAGGLLLAAVCAVGVIRTDGFRPEYMENEVFVYHTRDILDALGPGESKRVVDKSRYASPDWSGSRWWGLAKGRNVIIIQVEALQNFVIGARYGDQELTPNLNRMLREDTLYFDHYYYQIGGANTADAEFAVNNSLFGPEDDGAYVRYPQNHYYSLPTLLKDNGYSKAGAFHGYTGTFWNRELAYPGQGMDDFISLEDLKETDMFPMGLSDREFFRQSAEILASYEEPFYAFFITLSSHYPYSIPPKDREIDLEESDVGTLFGLYMDAVNYDDRAIGEFMEELKEIGFYDNSIIVIYGDHYALPCADETIGKRVSSLTGEPYTLFDQFNVPLLIHIPGSGITQTFPIAGGHMDVMPTLLCLLGLENDRAVMFGQNLLDAEHGFVCEQAHVSIGSFISDEVFYQKPHNNIRSNYSVYDRETLARLDPDLYEEEAEMAENRIRDCAALLARDDIFLDEAP
ncbi:MAG: LTA synthase family protein [Clostridia bacterium]|nr:LTA synthase family protein [Clostridia bacterium]